MTEPVKVTSVIKTAKGDAEISIELYKDDGRLVLHCFMPPCGGAGIFMQFDAKTPVADSTEAMKMVINIGPFEENRNLTDHFNFKGCMAVGTGNSVVKQISNAAIGSRMPCTG